MKTHQKHIAFLYKTFLGKYAKQEKGFVLVLTLMMISLLSVLAVTSFELVISTIRITNNHKNYLKTLYTADAGVEHTLCVLSKVIWTGFAWTEPNFSLLGLDSIDASPNSPVWSYNSVSKQWQMTNNQLGDSYTVIMTMVVDVSDSNNNRFHLVSTGTVSSFTKTIEADIGNIPTPKITLWMEQGT
jgi:hypothetical protein